jgi:hypothetical protein
VHRVFVVVSLGALTLAGVSLAQTGQSSTAQHVDPHGTPPDLTGRWVLDTSKSDFGLLPAPGADTSIYTRDGNVYRVVETGLTDSGATRITYSWPVGSGEVTSDLPDQEVRVLTRVTQHGDTGAFVSQLQHEGKTIEIESGREYLSPDRKTRTRDYDLQSFANPDEDVQRVVAVFRKIE